MVVNDPTSPIGGQMFKHPNSILTDSMKTPRMKKSPRPLFAVAALVVAFSVVSAPMAQAIFYNLVRDAFTGWEIGPWTDLKADANVAACQPAAQTNSGQSWMVEPLTQYLANMSSGGANYGYMDALSYSQSAYRSWYMYYAFNDMANINSYLANIKSYDDAYSQLLSAYSSQFSNEYFAAETALREAFFVAPIDQQESFIGTLPAVFNAYYNAKTVNDDYYNYEIGEYAYFTWASYGAPLYGTTVFMSRLCSLASDQWYNAESAAFYNYDLYPNAPNPDPEGYSAYLEQLDAYYSPITSYYSAYTQYYRLLSNYYEG